MEKGPNSEISHTGIWKLYTIFIVYLNFDLFPFSLNWLWHWHQVVFQEISSISLGFQVKHACSKIGAGKTLIYLLLLYHAASFISLYVHIIDKSNLILQRFYNVNVKRWKNITPHYLNFYLIKICQFSFFLIYFGFIWKKQRKKMNWFVYFFMISAISSVLFWWVFCWSSR